MTHHLLAFALTLVAFGGLTWLANRKSAALPGERIIKPPFVTQAVAVAIVSFAFFIVPEIAENTLQTVIGYALVALGGFACLRINTTRIVVSNTLIREVSLFTNRTILWKNLVKVRTSRIDAAFVIEGMDGVKIKIYHLFTGALQFEEEVNRRIAQPHKHPPPD